jgi:UDP-N-acetylglucosamine 2-epimerase (non-hydrolysing)
VAGARPNFVKIGPVVAALREFPQEIETTLVHTGQHYDQAMSESFFQDLGIPSPDVHLNVGSGSHAQQTAEIMKRFEAVLLERRPDYVLVVGDVNSTIACALTAAKLQIGVIHVEAGLRSFDREMPEEINRVLTDHLSDYLFITEESGLRNLRHEGIPDERIHLVGNVMIDSLRKQLESAARSCALEKYGVAPREYGLVTLHRPSNVDDPEVFRGILTALQEISKNLPLLFPLHPRTAAHVGEWGLDGFFSAGLRKAEPIGYVEFLQLMRHARVVFTDSGGIQEETTVLGVPCLTLRHNTERPVTIEIGTNQLVGTDPGKILAAAREVLGREMPEAIMPPLWDGKAANRIADVLRKAPKRF